MNNLGMYQPQYTPMMMANQTAEQIQQSPNGLMGMMWDKSQNNLSNTYQDIGSSWNNSSGLMGFLQSLRSKGYGQMKEDPNPYRQPTLEELGYRSY